MLHPNPAVRARRSAGLALVAGLALAAIPATAQAAAIDLATAGPFVVLGGSAVTNTGPSVLNGDLGVSPGTSLTGFDAATVNGATHDNDAVAANAQGDLTTAYNAAAGEPVTADETGVDLGNLTLTPGVYAFSSSAQLTGELVLDAQGDPNAQFIFQIGTALTTASNSSVSIINGGSPCNVFWQIGSSATLGTGTAFQGSLLALTSITLNSGATVQGRALARNGAVTLDNNVLDGSNCGTSATPPPGILVPPFFPPPTGTSPPGTGTTPPADTATGGTQTGDSSTGGSSPTPPTTPGTPTSGNAANPGPGAGGQPGASQVPPASTTSIATRNGSATLTRTRRASCGLGFTATVRGRQIRRVVFTLDGRRIASRSGSPFRVTVRALHGSHVVRAHVTFKDATRSRTLKLGYRVCAAVVLRPRSGAAHFTG